MPLPKFSEWLTKRKPSEENTQENTVVEKNNEAAPSIPFETLPEGAYETGPADFPFLAHPEPDEPTIEERWWTPGLHRLNETDAKELTAIKGIGPKTARKVLESVPIQSFDSLDLPAHVIVKIQNHYEPDSQDKEQFKQATPEMTDPASDEVV